LDWDFLLGLNSIVGFSTKNTDYNRNFSLSNF